MQWSTSAIQFAAVFPLSIVSVDIIRKLVQNRGQRKSYPLPPGPSPLPFLGSALSVDFEEPFKTYTEWRAKYGDIMYIRLLDVDVVVLNSLDVTSDLLEKRSQTYSDRPFIATLDLYGHTSCNFSLIPYGEHWRLCRRIFHQTFRAEAVVTFRPEQLRKARQMIMNIVDDPKSFMSHYSTFGSAVTMSTVYNYDPSPRNDKMVSVMNTFLEYSVPALMPEKAALFKVFPFLLHIPDWLPGSSIKHGAKAAREWSVKAVEIPYQYAKKRIESKENHGPSMISDHVSRMEHFDSSNPYHSQYEKALKEAASTAFMASIETTSSVLTSFTFAMVKNPRVLRHAQAEIDAVVGTDRLPEFDDRESLPYVDAILREVLRWHPPVPLIPHANITSDIYNGFYIPKGATVVANTWGITRDEDRYPSAETFIPERFLDAQGKLTDDSVDYMFGFGRRMCPGRHFAIASLWSAIATMLATFDFNLDRDSDINMEARFVNGITRHMRPFPCSITPRSHINKAFLEKQGRR